MAGMTVRHRMPQAIRFPGGFRIEIKKTKLTGEWGNWDYNLEAAAGIIKINSRADLARQWRTLAHELLHAASDFEHYVEESIARPLETEMGRTASDLRDHE